MSHKITVEGGKTVRLPTAGKYCLQDIEVTAQGGGSAAKLQSKTVYPMHEAQEVKPDAGYDGLEKVTVNPIPDTYHDTSIVNITADKMLVGTTVVQKDGSVLDGEMPDNGAVSAILDKNTTSFPIPKGYHNGDGAVSIELEGKIIDPSKDLQYAFPSDGKVLGGVMVGAIPDEYIIPEGELEITANGTHDVTAYASVNVNVPTGGGDPTALLDAALTNTLTAIDSDVTSIVAYACRGLSKLNTVNLPNATIIGTYAFYYCTAMSSFSAPKVATLNTYAFYNCDKLTSINFPLATSIPTQCFYSCGVLKKADFGAAKSIAASAFPYCAELVTLILRRPDAICTLANENAFTGTPIEDGTGYVYVPAALIETYKTASKWSTFASQFRAIEDYPDICG